MGIFRELRKMGTGKLADYYISGIGCNFRQKIVRVRVHEDRMGRLGSSETWHRQEVISKIEKGFVFTTVYKEDGIWRRGKNVDIIEIDGVKHIRTDRNRTGGDNLGELPEI